MARPATAKSLEAELEGTRRAQRAAADPLASAWVSANAGTGKTHVLTMRVLRLMLAGTPPERILCLTYTKAAAAEMSKRAFDELAAWVAKPQSGLVTALEGLSGRAPAAEEVERARTLFTTAIETPGGLKVQTIHAFCERLLHRFPLEANVTPGFAILEEEQAAALRREAINSVLGAAARQRSSILGRALQSVIAYAADERFDEILAEALKFRTWLREPITEETRRLFCRCFGVREGATSEQLEAEMASVLTQASLIGLREILAAGTRSEVTLAEALATAVNAVKDKARAEALGSVFLTKEGEPRKSLMTKGTAAANSEAEARLRDAQDRFARLNNERFGLGVVEATMALANLSAAIIARYDDAKVHRAALDFDDLIDKSRTLLSDASSAAWVLYKLDSGVDHVLVDESQDTSPEQWAVIEALANEFFSGSGAREEVRTLFAVGDEKQSIYSFQGADREMFAKKGRDFGALAKSADAQWRPISLNVSFRTVAPILAAVDRVFADRGRTPGVSVEENGLQHVAKRAGHAGLVEIWPTERHDHVPAADAWSPYEEKTAAAPVVRLANRIADTIKGWIDSGERLASEDRPIAPGDILILVRKRKPFAAPMVAALKSRDIRVAGSDRMVLTEHIAVQDLVSLGDFLTLPENDLALAEVLKSPVFNFDDGDLFDLAYGRKGHLWKALLDNAKAKARYAEAAETLKRWRKAADFTPPYEFFAALLDRDGVRARLLARLGPEAADPLDEFLNLALTYDEGAPPSLTGFLEFLRTGTRVIKRDMDHGANEVRVMTVHGAKGLEAPIVFLPDTCSPASGGPRRGRLLKLKALDASPARLASASPFVWPVKETEKLEVIRKARAEIDTAEAEEHNRLLYVAMTRARDRLYVAGFEGRRGRDESCWYETISKGLEGVLGTAEGAGGLEVLRLSSPQIAVPEQPKVKPTADEAGVAFPDWARRSAPREPQLTVPLAPSRLAPYETDDTGEPLPTDRPRHVLAEPSATVELPGGEGRFLRGTLTHALLEHLPLLDRATWRQAAEAFVARRGAVLSGGQQASIVAETLAVLNNTALAALFGPTSRAEVPIVAVIPRPRGSGPALRIAGQIDRLVELGSEVLIVDYKTNRTAPRDAGGVAPVYLYQLAAYRLAVAGIFRGKTVRAGLLWTDVPRIMEIPYTLLDTYESRLWDLDPALLDA